MKSVTATTMRRLDAKAVSRFGIPSLLLMENAGVACALEAVRLLKGKKRNVLCLCGRGNNGGDGFVIARQLFNRGFNPTVFFFQNPRRMRPDPKMNLAILKKMRIPLIDFSNRKNLKKLETSLKRTSLVVDGLFGTGLSKPLEGAFREVVEKVNASGKRVLSVDIPSGLHADTGKILGGCVKAHTTVTLGLPKKGLKRGKGRAMSGRVVVADISLPRQLLR